MIPEREGTKRSMKIQRGMLALVVLLLAAVLFVSAGSAADVSKPLVLTDGKAEVTIDKAVTITDGQIVDLMIDLSQLVPKDGKNIGFTAEVVGLQYKVNNISIKTGASTGGEITNLKIGDSAVLTLAPLDPTGHDQYGIDFDFGDYPITKPIKIQGTVETTQTPVSGHITFSGMANETKSVESVKVRIILTNVKEYAAGSQLMLESNAIFGADKYIYTLSEEVEEIQPTITPTVVPPTGEETETTITVPATEAITYESETKAVIEDTTTGVSLTINFEDPVDITDNKKVEGNVSTVVASYPEKPAGAGDKIPVGEKVNYSMNIEMGGVPQALPELDPSFDETIGEEVENVQNFVYSPLAMITALGTGKDKVNEVLEATDGTIKLTFYIPYSSNVNKDKLVVLHVYLDGGSYKVEKVALDGTPVLETKEGKNFWKVTGKGKKFSSYVVAEDNTPESGGDEDDEDEYWPTEIPTVTPTDNATQTPTPTPTVTPTDNETQTPTETPTQTPTETETPASPGFGVLAVLAGLGAVVALRRR